MDAQGEPVKFQLRRLPPVILAEDLSNLNTVDFSTYKAALFGDRGNDVLQASLDQLEVIARQGKGFNLQSLPPPYRQTGLNCQVYGFINGLQAWLGTNGVSALIPQVETIRGRATTRKGTMGMPDTIYSISGVADVLREMGLIQYMSFEDNPIAGAQQLFSGSGFVINNKSNQWHVTTLIPHEYVEGGERFAIEVDSLTGNQKTMSAGEFLVTNAKRNPIDDKSYFCRVIPV